MENCRHPQWLAAGSALWWRQQWQWHSRVVKPVTVFENNRREDNDEKREHRGSRLGVLEDNLQNDVAGVPTAIDHFLE